MTNIVNHIKISVAICTYNGEKRLPEVLEALSAQEGIEQGEWEILLIDNVSTDETRKVFARFAQKHPEILCRYVYEPVPGTNAARLRAIEKAFGAWICFVDDDNILDKQYLSTALRFTSDKSNIGAFGGRSEARLEVPAPQWFSAIKSGLAIYDVVEESRQLKIGERSFTAGLVVNTEVARQVASEIWIMTGRSKGFPIAGEDFELCLKISRLHKEIWYVPGLLFIHVIPENRLELKYLRELFATFGATYLLLYPVYFPCWNSRLLTMFKIISGAVLKIPVLSVLSIVISKKKWTFAKGIWAYTGIIKYSGFALKRLMF